MNNNAEEKELERAARNLFLDPEKDDTLSLEDDTFFENIYGKENFRKMEERREARLKEKQKN